MKQAFLKRFNPWGDTRHQQQDAWNKLKFDMTKGRRRRICSRYENAGQYTGVTMTMSLLRSSKIYFLDPNIEAALIAMDNFAAMQTKAKQLVQIYKPAHDSPIASAAILVHTVGYYSHKKQVVTT